MKSAKAPLRASFFAYSGTWNQELKPGLLEQNGSGATIALWISEGKTNSPSTNRDSQTFPDSVISCDVRQDAAVLLSGPDLTFADFVERVFVPEHATAKRPAGRAHLKGILKHVLNPGRVERAFGIVPASGESAKEVDGWPYLGQMRLADICPHHVHAIITAALERGYSTQTATHIRSVVSLVFSHARKSGYFLGENPANLVPLPAVVHRERHALTLEQLADLLRIMRYPEREISLLAILTGMSIGEICGLQWRYVNLSDTYRIVDGERIAPRTIVIRRQSSRCELQDVKGHRKREILISDFLVSVLANVKKRARHSSGKDFVLASRNGTPINQDNIASRRLKEIGSRRGMPWLSWQVFHRTHRKLDSQFGIHLERQLQNVLRLNLSAAHSDAVSLRPKLRKKLASDRSSSDLTYTMST